MIPQGSAIINPQYFSNMIAEFEAINTCAELQLAVNRAFASLQAEKSAVDAQIAELAPMLALLTAPLSPTAAVTWIENLITSVLTPYLKPAITYAAKATAFSAQIASLSTAIATAAGRLGSCSITIPPIV